MNTGTATGIFAAMRGLMLCAFFAFCGSLIAQFQEVQISVFSDQRVSAATVISIMGSLSIQADGRTVGEVGPNDGLRIALVEGNLEARTMSKSYLAKKTFTLVPRHAESGVRIRPTVPKLAERGYPGAMEVRKEKGAMRFISEPSLETYVAGVVQSEAGREKALDYYKLQSVGCRTYALANSRKHHSEGFQLCDQVHCQVYNGACTDPLIVKATNETRSMVVVDADIRLIHATFHSNCGGETLNAEDVWSKSEPYLRATRDTFCLAQPHAVWEFRMDRGAWLKYLHDSYGLALDNAASVSEVLSYEPSCRDVFLNTRKPLVPLSQVRSDLKLRSTFFRLSTEGNSVHFAGRGFGHGVGLCQEGAMEMARQGIGFVDILHHYYAEVHLVDLSMLDFFRDEVR